MEIKLNKEWTGLFYWCRNNEDVEYARGSVRKAILCELGSMEISDTTYELLKTAAVLAKQHIDLIQDHDDLTREVERLEKENIKLKATLDSIKPLPLDPPDQSDKLFSVCMKNGEIRYSWIKPGWSHKP